MKRALILTVWDAPNYGSFLQAMAMKKFLEEKGYHVKFIQYRNKLEQRKFLFEKKKQFLFHPIFSIHRAREFVKEHKQIETTKISKIKDSDYDLVVIGSDEIWNFRNDKFFSKEFFYGKGFAKDKILVYSVSVGTGTLEDLQKKDEIINCIKELKHDNISVRDLTTFQIVSKIKQNNEIKITCDPTFLIDKNKYIKQYKKKLTDNFMVVYSYRIPEKLKENIMKFAKENNLKVISLCNYYDFCDENICCSPLAFSDIINKAKFVVVTTFHGTIFSIFNHKQFIAATAKQKTTDLLHKLSLEERMIDEECEYTEFLQKMNEKINYSKIDSKILEMRQESIKWLAEKID